MTNKYTVMSYIILSAILMLPINARASPKTQTDATITLQGNIENRGSILCVTDSSLILWKNSKVYDKNQIKENAIELTYSDIDLIVLKTEKGTQKKWALGCGIGGFAAGFIGNFIVQNIVNDAGRTDVKSMLTLGGLYGVGSGIVGFSYGLLNKQTKSDVILIKENYNAFQASMPKLKQAAIFSDRLPVELQKLWKIK
jgi:hypothetical protein